MPSVNKAFFRSILIRFTNYSLGKWFKLFMAMAVKTYSKLIRALLINDQKIIPVIFGSIQIRQFFEK